MTSTRRGSCTRAARVAMRMLRRKSVVFAPTDGVVALCRETDERLAAGFDWSTNAGLEPLCSLPYQSMELRQQDVELAETEGAQWTRKLRVRACPQLSTCLTVEVGGVPHELSRVDMDGRLAYLYLTELVADGTAELIETIEEYDELRQLRRTEVATTVTCRRQRPGAARDAAHDRDRLGATCELAIRARDWSGQTAIRRNGLLLAVTGATTLGAWVTLVCSQQGGAA